MSPRWAAPPSWRRALTGLLRTLPLTSRRLNAGPRRPLIHPPHFSSSPLIRGTRRHVPVPTPAAGRPARPAPPGALPLAAPRPRPWPPATVKIIVPYPPGAEPDVNGATTTAQLGRRHRQDIRGGQQARRQHHHRHAGAAQGEGRRQHGAADRPPGREVTNPMLPKMPTCGGEHQAGDDLARCTCSWRCARASPAQNYRELIAYARQGNPGKINIGTGGSGHVTHIAAAVIAQGEGVQFPVRCPTAAWRRPWPGIVGGEVDALLARRPRALAAHQASGRSASGGGRRVAPAPADVADRGRGRRAAPERALPRCSAC